MRKFVLATCAFSALIAPAAAADLPLRAVPPAFSWAGWYVGGNVGWKGLDTNMSSAPNDPATTAFNTGCITAGACPQAYGSSSGSGVIGGGQIGYNWQFSNWVAGVETDFQGSYARATTTVATSVAPFVPFTGTHQTQEDWLGTLRGRLGVLFTPTLLAYGTGGFAYSAVERNWSGNFQSVAASSWFGSTTSTLTGWTAGVGLEWAVGYGFTVGAEYLYVKLGGGDTFLTNIQGGACIPGPLCTFSIRGADVTDNIVRAKLNYKF